VNFAVNQEQPEPDTAFIDLVGEVDLYTAPQFKEALAECIEAQATRVVIDMTRTTFIDSTVLGVLVGGLRRLRPAGGEMALVITSRDLAKIFEITGLNRVFIMAESRDEALSALAVRS
jgi:anti-sigma B factor antagonist